MKNISRYIIAALILLGPAALANELTLSDLNKKAQAGIDRVVPAGQHPGKCAMKYSIKTESRTGPVGKRPSQDEIIAMLKDPDGLAKAEAAMDALRKESTIARTYAELEYKDGGVAKKEILFDLPVKVESGEASLQHWAETLVYISGRACPGQQSELKKAAPQAPKQQTEAPSTAT